MSVYRRMKPEPIACARCGFPRTVRHGLRHVCFQCRYSWKAVDQRRGVTSDAVGAEAPVGWPFTEAEVGRLRIYRAAVRAGFYSDD